MRLRNFHKEQEETSGIIFGCYILEEFSITNIPCHSTVLRLWSLHTFLSEVGAFRTQSRILSICQRIEPRRQVHSTDWKIKSSGALRLSKGFERSVYMNFRHLMYRYLKTHITLLQIHVIVCRLSLETCNVTFDYQTYIWYKHFLFIKYFYNRLCLWKWSIRHMGWTERQPVNPQRKYQCTQSQPDSTHNDNLRIGKLALWC